MFWATRSGFGTGRSGDADLRSSAARRHYLYEPKNQPPLIVFPPIPIYLELIVSHSDKHPLDTVMSISVDDLISSFSTSHIGQEATDLAQLQVGTVYCG